MTGTQKAAWESRDRIRPKKFFPGGVPFYRWGRKGKNFFGVVHWSLLEFTGVDLAVGRHLAVGHHLMASKHAGGGGVYTQGGVLPVNPLGPA